MSGQSINARHGGAHLWAEEAQRRQREKWEAVERAREVEQKRLAMVAEHWARVAARERAVKKKTTETKRKLS
jgi:hypothetical protein